MSPDVGKMPYFVEMPPRPPLSQFRAALFDVDGTLVDSLGYVVIAIAEAIHSFTGKQIPKAEIRALVGMPLARQMSFYALDPGDIEPMVRDSIQRMAANATEERVFEGAVQTLAICRRVGIKTALVTSKNADELKIFLQRFTQADSVDVTVCASDVLRPKPDPESALLACERLGVEPGESVFIGDSIYDMRCAKDAGMTCVAVAYGAGDRALLEAEMPDVLFDTPEELFAWGQEAILQTSCREKS
jgi:pyrophosphatase PpaX